MRACKEIKIKLGFHDIVFMLQKKTRPFFFFFELQVWGYLERNNQMLRVLYFIVALSVSCEP